MHFNYRAFADNVVWLLENTRLCHPDNFLACLFVSDWGNSPLPDLGKSPHGAMTRFLDCPANGPVTIPSTNATWHGFYMHKCYAESLKWAHDLGGVHGVLFLADDTVIVQPWKALSIDLQNHGGIVLPGIQDPMLKLDTNLLDRSTWPPQGIDEWFWEVDSLDPGPSRLLSALKAFSPEEKQRLGMTSQLVPVFKSSADAIYVPLSQAADFQRLADLFYVSGVFAEYAVSQIARAIDGQHALLGPHEALLLKSLWGADRKDLWTTISNLRLSQAACMTGATTLLGCSGASIAFVHPVKLGGTGADGVRNRAELKSLYDFVFA